MIAKRSPHKARARETLRTLPTAGPVRDGLSVFCGADAFGHTPEAMAASASLAGIPSLVLSPGMDLAAVRWPPVRRAAVFGHGAMTDDAVQALATAMICAGIDEVFVCGERVRGRGAQGRGPWTFKATAAP